jgi:hypothetical protein
VGVFILFVAYPGPFAPYPFEWAVAMALEPPTAEGELCKEDGNTDKQTDGVTTIEC